MSKFKDIKAAPKYEVVYQDLCALVGKHKDEVSAYEILAIAANMLGKLIAMQDQRAVTKEMAFDLIMKNIEIGNKQVFDALNNTKGSRQ